MTDTFVHHLNCGTMRPVGARWASELVVAHVLLVERDDALLLVDTGFGTADLASPRRLGTPFVTMMRPELDEAETAVRQVEALGYAASDVRDIVVTHMDLDHVGGIGDFPDARIHVDLAELDAARNPSLRERSRYRNVQWSHGPRFVPHSTGGDRWFGFDSVRAVGDDVLLVPLRGHSRGHCGVAVRESVDGEDRWLLHAGDSHFFHGEIATPPHTRPGLTFFQKIMAADEKARRHNQARLAELATAHPEVRVFSAHDPADLTRFAR
ncbi:MBL fold metallo-hydrolase [Nocardioides alcanivorans]|uniref:MBL fold metallo-hydrolase n=1 Tax=Nocardioides alcanivorans TaxID=2897352 RepID=UPI001F45F59B|nr:MBL fold metallo-hydrolase [Nocardioides alcanivorans]